MIGERIAKELDKYVYSVGIDRMFSDFLDYCMWALSACTIPMSGKQEPEHVERLFSMFKLLQEAEPFEDIFGSIYEEVAGKYKKSKMGQFFTPMWMCDLMSIILLKDINKIPIDDTVFMHEPSVGSGRNVLSATREYRKRRKFGKMFWASIDLDPMCAKMAAMNMVLNDIEGIVYYGDTLSLELYAAYYITRHPILRIPTITKLEGDDFTAALRFMKGDPTPEPPKEEQITLFNVEPVAYLKEQAKRSKGKSINIDNQPTLF